MIIYYHCTRDNALLLSFLLTHHPYIPLISFLLTHHPYFPLIFHDFMILYLHADIDECDLERCEQICNNTIGSYSCDCLSNYSLSSNHHTCLGIYS